MDDLERKLNKIFDCTNKIAESVSKDKLLNWLNHNNIRVNKLGGKDLNAKFEHFAIAITKSEWDPNSRTASDPELYLWKENLSSDELQRVISNFRMLKSDEDSENLDIDMENADAAADEFMQDANFYALASAKDADNSLFGIAVFSMDDPKFAQLDDDDEELPSDDELFGLDRDELERLWTT